MKRAHKIRCKTPNGRKEFLKHVSCIQNETISEPIHACVDKVSCSVNEREHPMLITHFLTAAVDVDDQLHFGKRL